MAYSRAGGCEDNYAVCYDYVRYGGRLALSDYRLILQLLPRIGVAGRGSRLLHSIVRKGKRIQK
ncbi:hypothetical protein [Paenibacillus radicis (ex Xue et al. 2023)]|uniref:Uncharacterized protein n=1 Tax=Paenibacillus radicis (ex Xue et al. 2023) TaxID=2972489 RepID=A0ABT1YIR2_9BACL|nr:hypothetical protein [Paenibacillus radicis (ex Xue et al. 2023)]MCR8633071.1 hypothetical protein [Paenibacillus radicis (ex Xue et al. 2023)]